MLRSLIATALAVCVSAAIGCSKKDEKPAASGPPSTKTEATTTIPADASNTMVDTTIPLPPPLYESGEVGTAVKPDGTIDGPRDDFHPSDHMYVSIKAREVPKGLAANMTVKDPDKKIVLDTRSEFSPATSRAVFPVTDLSKWKPGLYDIEVVMEGDVVFKHGVRIMGKTGGKSAKSKSQ